MVSFVWDVDSSRDSVDSSTSWMSCSVDTSCRLSITLRSATSWLIRSGVDGAMDILATRSTIASTGSGCVMLTMGLDEPSGYGTAGTVGWSSMDLDLGPCLILTCVARPLGFGLV